jgi:hypothetical protein
MISEAATQTSQIRNKKSHKIKAVSIQLIWFSLTPKCTVKTSNITFLFFIHFYRKGKGILVSNTSLMTPTTCTVFYH